MPSSVLLSCQWTLYSQQFFAMFMKRAMFSWRNWNLILLQILALLGIFYFLMSDVELSIGEEDLDREMDLEQYGQTIVPFSISGNSEFTMNFVKNLEILLKAKKQKLHEVKGKPLLKKKRLLVDKDLIVFFQKKVLTGIFSYLLFFFMIVS